MKYVPHEYQKIAITRLVENCSVGLLADPGLGKTSITLSAYKELKRRGCVTAMLVVCPLDPLYDTWPSEVKKWSNFKDLRVAILHGANKDKELEKKSDVYLINPAGLSWLVKSIKKWPFNMLVVDESTEFKNSSSKRFKLLRMLLRSGKFDGRYILTGTPIPNSLIDLYSQIYILDNGDALGKNLSSYRNEYFVPDYMGWKWTIKPRAENKIFKSIKNLVLRLDEKDHLQLPALTVVDRWVNLPKKAREVYEDLKKEFIVEIGKRTVKASNAAVLTGKLRQVANGSVYQEDGKAFLTVHREKDRVTANLIKEMFGQKVVVSYEFNNARDNLKKEMHKTFGFTPRHIGTGVGRAEKIRILKDFKEGSSNILLGQISSMSYGLNLQVSHNMIMHGVGWSQYKQLTRRLWRQGQEHPVIINRVLARDTIDEDVIESLANKNATQKSFLDHLKQKYL